MIITKKILVTNFYFNSETPHIKLLELNIFIKKIEIIIYYLFIINLFNELDYSNIRS